MPSVEVTVDLGGDEVAAGILRVHDHRGQRTTFEYAAGYWSDARAYDLDPALPIGSGVHRPPLGKAVFNAFADSAPDRWGRNLLRRQERDRAEARGQTPRALGPVDFLLGARDTLRQGAVRFREPETDRYIATDDVGVPALVSLPQLLAETDRYLGGGGRVKDLIDAGGSLGGARPKAAVRTEGGTLATAKFPRKGDDEWDVPGWEQVTSTLAVRAGITMAKSWLIRVANRNVFVAERFDRHEGHRVGFVSALTLLEASDMEDDRSYLELADLIEAHSGRPDADLEQLFRRVAFSVLVSNTDDHLRNHAFLRSSRAWNLSPAYDVNPNPESPGHLSLAVDFDDSTASIDLLLSVAGSFRLSLPRAKEIVQEVEDASAGWKEVALRLGIAKRECTRMAGAFETPERTAARQLGQSVATSSTVSCGAPTRTGSPCRRPLAPGSVCPDHGVRAPV